MTMVIILLLLISILFAVNMGGSNIAASMSVAFGSNLISRKKASLLFGVFVLLGALLLGRNVSETVGKGLVESRVLTSGVVFVIIASATVSLFFANLLKIPQSTSQATVGAITGAGLFFWALKPDKYPMMLSQWIILPIVSYLITLFLGKFFYSRMQRWFKSHTLLRQSTLLKTIVIITSLYVSFAIGSNNVANVVGPLLCLCPYNYKCCAIIFAPLFGIGAFLLGKGTLETVGKEIIPIGLLGSSLVSFTTATLMIFASIKGVPQSLVQLNALSIFALGCVKNGHKSMIKHPSVNKAAIVWVIAPILSMVLSYSLLFVFFHTGLIQK